MVGTHPELKPVKSATAFRTISEVSGELDVPQHVLRFWETKFTQIRPLKRGGGRRYYRPEDVDLLRRIQSLLYKEGYTIKGVQRLLRESRGGRQEPAPGDLVTDEMVPALDDAELEVEPGAEPEPEHEIEIDGDVIPTGMTAAQRAELEAILDSLMALRALLPPKS
ncbi:MAG: MerR family transcriptional regulator [Azospirillaceae bacterium]|nr:MerR family transcriptional regulator [Azospirillaceae bacterium]